MASDVPRRILECEHCRTTTRHTYLDRRRGHLIGPGRIKDRDGRLEAAIEFAPAPEARGFGAAIEERWRCEECGQVRRYGLDIVYAELEAPAA